MALFVAAPAKEIPVAQCATVTLREGKILDHGEAPHRDRGMHVEILVRQLPPSVPAPALHRALIVQGAGVTLAGTDPCDVGQVDRDGASLHGPFPSQLLELVVTPAIHLAVAL